MKTPPVHPNRGSSCILLSYPIHLEWHQLIDSRPQNTTQTIRFGDFNHQPHHISSPSHSQAPMTHGYIFQCAFSWVYRGRGQYQHMGGIVYDLLWLKRLSHTGIKLQQSDQHPALRLQLEAVQGDPTAMMIQLRSSA